MIRLSRLLDSIFVNTEEIMAAIDVLNSEVARLQADVDKVKAKVADLKAASGVPESQVQAAADALKTANDALEAAIV